MATLERPQLRSLSGRRIDHRGHDTLALTDPLGAFRDQVLIPASTFQQVVRHFDGRSTIAEICGLIERASGSRPAFDEVMRLVEDLDRRMVLDGPTFAAHASAYARLPVREAAFAGRSYPADPVRLKAELECTFADPRGVDHAPAHAGPASRDLRAVLSPHIDFGRGGPIYSWAYRELAERSDADIYVILGVAHQPCRHRFALTRKDFATPLGLARTDRAFVDRLAEGDGAGWFEDELVHRTEHSAEFQVVYLQHVLGGRRDFAIVPILVGSFHDLMRAGVAPIDDPEVARMVGALKAAEVASGKRVAYIGGIDLCHVGPEFGDPGPVDDALLGRVRDFDRAMLDRAVALDPAGWFGHAAEAQNRYRVCGLAATYTMLHAIGPSVGRLLRYDQAVDPRADLLRQLRQRRLRRPEPGALSAPSPDRVDLRAEVLAYDRAAAVAAWAGPSHRVRYRVLGQGPPLILIPGLASTYRAYAATLNRLAARFRTIQLEYPGEDPDDGADLRSIDHDDLAADVIGLADHLHLDRPALFGLSFGSTVALRALAMAPDRFRSAVLQGGFARRELKPAERLALKLGRRFRGPTSNLPFHRVGLAKGNKFTFQGPDKADRWAFYVEQNGLTPLTGLSHRLDLMDRLDLRPSLPEIPHPVLLLHGLDDQIVPPRHLEELASLLPGARPVPLPGVGHQPHYTHPEEFAGWVAGFVEEVG